MRPIKRTEDDNKLKGLNIIIPITKKVEIKRIIKLVVKIQGPLIKMETFPLPQENVNF